MKSQLAGWIWMAVALATPLRAEYRTWTNTEGVKIEAELVKAEGGNVTMRLRNGSLSTFPQSKLSEADIEFIKTAQSASEFPAAKPSVALGRRATWLTKMDKAKEEAKETGLPILVLFTGTSWCKFCIWLEKEVFDKKEFKEFADQNLVLLKFDYGPGNKINSKEAEELKKVYGFAGYPTYFLTDPSGRKLARGAYHHGINPKEFAEWVKKSSPK